MIGSRKLSKIGVGLLIFLLLDQFFARYVPFAIIFNAYTFSVVVSILMLLFWKVKMRSVFMIIVAALTLAYFCYRYSQSNISTFLSVAIKSMQFNFGYLLLLPGMFNFLGFWKFNFPVFIKRVFYFFVFEAFVEFLSLKIFHFSPFIFKHFEKDYLIDSNFNSIDITRIFGLSGNASVSGVQLVFIYILYTITRARPIRKLKDFIEKENLPAFLCFVSVFLMLHSGSAFFSVVAAILILMIRKQSFWMKLLLSVLVSVILVYSYFVLDFSETVSNKFDIRYLFFLLFDQESHSSIGAQFLQFIDDYGINNIIFGNYLIKWGSQDEQTVFMSVDYSYLNLLFEFGIVGLIVYLWTFRSIYKRVKSFFNTLLTGFGLNLLTFAFLVLLLGSFHYPAISYYFTQVLTAVLYGYARNKQNLEAAEAEITNAHIKLQAG